MPLVSVIALAQPGCLDEEAALEARQQRITFDELPTPAIDQRSIVVSAHASSGLPVAYLSLTPHVCSVDPRSGLVVADAPGACTIQAEQPGDGVFAPAHPVTRSVLFHFSDSLRFESALSLGLYDAETVRARSGSGAPVAYGTTTPLVCSVDGQTGLVIALSPGTCTVVATAGASEATQDVVVTVPPSTSAPSVPAGVTATSAGTANSVKVSAYSVASGGSPIVEYAVASIPAGIASRSASLPVTVTCPSGCGGYAFSLSAMNALGSSPAAAADVITTYAVTSIFKEPDTQPNDTIFLGQYAFNATRGTVSDLGGRLSEAMTGGSSPYPNDTMNWLPLSHQLSAQPIELDGVSGVLVTAFLLPTTQTLARDPAFGGTDGWAPGSGMGLYYGYPGTNSGNAYVVVFVNTQDPLAPLSAGQVSKLAYADCAPGAMMGATCMTGTSIAGYGSLGTMGGYPISQVTVQP